MSQIRSTINEVQSLEEVNNMSNKFLMTQLNAADLSPVDDDNVDDDAGAALSANNNFVAAVQFTWAG